MDMAHPNPLFLAPPPQHAPLASTSKSASSMHIPAPSSRLSPPPGTSLTDIIASSTESGKPPKKRKDEGPKRGYRACVHCRLRKAKCDLGDVNSPSEPPCTRCRREQRNCVFLPSKRRRKTIDDDDGGDMFAGETHDLPEWKPIISNDLSQSSIHMPAPQNLPQYQNWSDPFNQNSNQNHNHNQSSIDTSIFNSLPQTSHAVLNQTLPQIPNGLGDGGNMNITTPASVPSVQSAVSIPESSTSGQSPTHRKRIREGDSTRRIVVANFSNETDALEILANAATDGKGKTGSPRGEGVQGEVVKDKKVSWSDQVGKGLNEFILIKLGILNTRSLESLVKLFFEHHHPALPVFQTARIPRDLAQLAKLCREDPFLISTLVAVASAHHPDPGMKEVHERTWAILRDALEDYTFNGSPATIGFVEGVLLLAENLPTEKMRKASELLATGEDAVGLHGTENRRSWALTGLAIRAAYGLGLDQIAIEINEGDRTADVERARSVWTWCYLYDRTIGLRTGLAFWSRGPSLCFVGYSHISQTGETAAVVNFPYMLNTSPSSQIHNPGARNTDSASLMQALVELTQIMTNAHDLLYPNQSRTDILVRQGEYFKFLDSFRRATDSFKLIWNLKKWNSPSLEQLCWCTYHFVRLYVSSFAFQAHVQRAQARAEAEAKTEAKERNVQLFPRGSATSPDAVYIYESIDAANEILQICLRLGQMGVLRYLPSRYLMNFVYGGVFALKAGYSGATSQKDMLKTRELVDHVCAALVLACPDRDHAASRYGQMLRMLSKKLEQLDASAVPSRYPSPEPPVHTASGGTGDASSNDFTWSLDIPSAFQMTPIQSQNTDQLLSTTNIGNTNTTNNNFNSGLMQGLSQLEPFNNPLSSSGTNSNPNPAPTGNGLFDFDVDVRFDLDGFWEDFTLGEGTGFPFR